MDKPTWIRKDVVLAIHRRLLAEHWGTEGLRDDGLLDSELAKPITLLADSEDRPDLNDLAAAYVHGIVKNHPFVDGNKRVGYVVCRTFLNLNGADMEATQEEKYSILLKLAEGTINQHELAGWLREHSSSR